MYNVKYSSYTVRDIFQISQDNLNNHLSCVMISHFHLDHCVALPYMTEIVGFSGQIYMTMPTKTICPILLVEVNMPVQHISFSAHADAKGIMQLIQHCEPPKVLLVHGEASKMEFLARKITRELGKECCMPANGETISFNTPLGVLH